MNSFINCKKKIVFIELKKNPNFLSFLICKFVSVVFVISILLIAVAYEV